MRLPLTSTTIMLVAAGLALAACGSDEEGSGKPTVAASTGILADITEQIGGGDVDVVQVIPDGSSPHDFQLSAQDRQEIEDSALFVINGANLEEGIPVDEIGTDRFELAENVGELLPFEEEGGERTDGGEEGGDDPHVWMDPARIAEAAPALAEALAEEDPGNADAYRKRGADYAAELIAVDASLERQLAAVPEDRRNLVTSHDALTYFADRYAFVVVATPFPASGPEAEPSAQAIVEVEDAIEESSVPTVFATEEDDPEVLSQIAERTGVEIVDDLLVESTGSAGSYVEMLRRDGELISRGLEGG